MRRSQSVNKSNHNVWAAVKRCGIVISAHCTCMAGLGDVCSHIAALLFKTWLTQERLAEKCLSSDACTSNKCTWIVPNLMPQVSAKPLADIKFSSKNMQQSTNFSHTVLDSTNMIIILCLFCLKFELFNEINRVLAFHNFSHTVLDSTIMIIILCLFCFKFELFNEINRELVFHNFSHTVLDYTNTIIILCLFCFKFELFNEINRVLVFHNFSHTVLDSTNMIIILCLLCLKCELFNEVNHVLVFHNFSHMGVTLWIISVSRDT